MGNGVPVPFTSLEKCAAENDRLRDTIHKIDLKLIKSQLDLRLANTKILAFKKVIDQYQEGKLHG